MRINWVEPKCETLSPYYKDFFLLFSHFLEINAKKKVKNT